MIVEVCFIGFVMILVTQYVYVKRSSAANASTLRARQQELALLSDAARKRFQDADARVYGLTHDLRNSLQSVLGYTALLMSDTSGHLTQRQRQFADNIRTGAMQILTVLENCESGSPEPQPAACSAQDRLASSAAAAGRGD